MNARALVEDFKVVVNRLQEPGSFDTGVTLSRAPRAFTCRELWAGNERAHRSFELPGLDADVIAVPCGEGSGGDLAAVFSCSNDIARVVLADCAGHGCVASGLARLIHRLLDKFRDIRDTESFLAALNNDFTLNTEESAGLLRLTTVVTAAFDAATGEFNFAYAAHPRMFLRRARDSRFCEIGRCLQNFPLGYIAGEHYLQRTIHLGVGDMILAFSDGATEVESATGVQLTAEGFAELAGQTLSEFSEPLPLSDFSQALLDSLHQYYGATDLEDDITLLTLRRSATWTGEEDD